MSQECNRVEFGCHLPNGGFIRNIYTNVDGIRKYRLKYNNEGVYSTAYRYNEDDVGTDTLMYGDFYMDFDKDAEAEDEDAFEEVRNDALRAITYFKTIFGIPKELIEIYFSGNKGLHLIVHGELYGLEPMKNLNYVYRTMAEDIASIAKTGTLDLQVYDNRRLWRLPNSRHQKTGLYKIHLSYDDLKNATYEEIKKAAKTAKPIPDKEYKPISRAKKHFNSYEGKWKKKKAMLSKKSKHGEGNLKVTPPCVDQLLKEGAGQGQRNNSAAAIASFYKQSGLSEYEATQKLIKWSNTYCSPPLPEREIDTVVRSIYTGTYKYGCFQLKLLAECKPDICPLKKGGEK